jgi:hypothetical protein
MKSWCSFGKWSRGNKVASLWQKNKCWLQEFGILITVLSMIQLCFFIYRNSTRMAAQYEGVSSCPGKAGTSHGERSWLEGGGRQRGVRVPTVLTAGSYLNRSELFPDPPRFYSFILLFLFS